MYTEALYGSGELGTGSTLDLDELVTWAISVWSAFLLTPLPTVNFTASYGALEAPVIGSIKCVERACGITISNSHSGVVDVMLHEVGHGFLFLSGNLSGYGFEGNHNVEAGSIMNRYIVASPHISERTVSALSHGGGNRLCHADCHCVPFELYPRAPSVCGPRYRVSLADPWVDGVLLGCLVAVLFIVCTVASTRHLFRASTQ
jgi:hypothetical protein